jgi:hypothetical protein
MQAVVDPSGPSVVGTIPSPSNLTGPWADFLTVPIPDGLADKPLKAEFVDDVWVISLDVDTVTAAAWAALRTERNARLVASDWTQLQDARLSAEKKAAWSDYRQALRDLPDSVTLTSPQDPASVEWPQINTPS